MPTKAAPHRLHANQGRSAADCMRRVKTGRDHANQGQSSPTAFQPRTVRADCMRRVETDHEIDI